MFARGAEEARALELAGVDYEVVPGITSAIAAPAYAGIPVTRRYSSTSLTIVTGHEDPSKAATQVTGRRCAVGGTLAHPMGVANLPEISRRLIAGGLDPDTPAAAVRWGTRPDQHVTRATLATFDQHPFAPPVDHRRGATRPTSRSSGSSGRPLSGRTVVVTRTLSPCRIPCRECCASAAPRWWRSRRSRSQDPVDGGAALAGGDVGPVVVPVAGRDVAERRAVGSMGRELRDAP